MFHKVYYRLALMCAGITIFILLSMSFISLSVSESGMKKNHFLSFQKDANTLAASIEQQTVITKEWLTRMESNNSYLIFILDNNIPFLFNSQNHRENEDLIYKEAIAACSSDSSLDTESDTSVYDSGYLEYKFTTSDGGHYQAFLASIERDAKEIQLLVLSPLDGLETQINRQRILFFSLDAAASVILLLFSFLFTKKLLAPVEQSRQEQIQFIASASHELRTPLAVILSCANACKKASPEEEEGFLTTIGTTGQQMSCLIDDMLFLSKADTHSLIIHMEEMEPDTLLLNSYEAFTALAREKDINLSIRLPEMPLSPIYSDKNRLSQVIAILLHNALCYTPSGGKILLSLSMSPHSPSDCIYTVSDNGPGIPDSEKENIFKRFYRADKSRSAKGHFGLGLCIASEIMASLKGRIQVTDTPGGGATFTVSVPAPAPLSQSHV